MSLAIVGNQEPIEATLADDESPEAIYRSADRHFNGDGVPENKMVAAELYRKAAEMGFVPAMRRYGWCLVSGAGISQRPAEAVAWYEKAAAQGDVWSMLQLGEALYRGTGINPDGNRSFAILDLASSKGSAYAKLDLAQWFYLPGAVVPQDVGRARALVEEVAAQEKNQDAKEQARMFLQAMSAANMTFWRRGFKHTYTYQQGVYSTVGGGIAGGGTGVGSYVNSGFQIKIENSSDYKASYYITGEIVRTATNEVIRRFNVNVPELQPSQSGSQGMELYDGELYKTTIKIDKIKVGLAGGFWVDWNPSVVLNEQKAKSGSGSGSGIFILMMIGVLAVGGYFGFRSPVESKVSVERPQIATTSVPNEAVSKSPSKPSVAQSANALNFDGTWQCDSPTQTEKGTPIRISGTEVRQGYTKYLLKTGHGLAIVGRSVEHLVPNTGKTRQIQKVELRPKPGYMAMIMQGKNSGAGSGVEFHKISADKLESKMFGVIENMDAPQSEVFFCSRQ